MDLLIGASLVILGLLIGSFLNVVIYRYPQGKSIVFPSSHCPKCETALKWYHNIPLFSYIFLGGKCAFCKEKISFRYPFVELLTAVLFLLSFLMVGFTYTLIFYIVFVILALLIAFIDYDEKIIPNLFLLLILINAFAYFLYNVLTIEGYDYWLHVIGFFAGFVPFWLIRLVASKCYQREALGFGDVKYMGVIGFFLGWQKVILIVLIASLLGSIIELILIGMKKKERGEEFAFGPYLVFGSLIAMLYGDIIINFYLKLFNIGWKHESIWIYRNEIWRKHNKR